MDEGARGARDVPKGPCKQRSSAAGRERRAGLSTGGEMTDWPQDAERVGPRQDWSLPGR